MNFSYTRVLDFPRHKKRIRLLPWIRVGIFNPKDPSKIIYALGLVDSGAEISMMDREIGEELGFEVEKGDKEEIIGVGGGAIPGFIHRVGYRIENPDGPKDVVQYEDLAIFTKNSFPNTMPQLTAIFGTIGFFRHLMVTFNFPKQIIIESPSS